MFPSTELASCKTIIDVTLIWFSYITVGHLLSVAVMAILVSASTCTKDSNANWAHAVIPPGYTW